MRALSTTDRNLNYLQPVRKFSDKKILALGSNYNISSAVGRSSGNVLVPGTIGLRFKSWTDQIDYSVANDLLC